jgi:glutathione synthase
MSTTTVRLGIVVNDLSIEEPHDDALGLAFTAAKRGHETWMMSAPRLACRPDGSVTAVARVAPAPVGTTDDFARALRAPENSAQAIDLRRLDVLMIRSDPSGTTGGNSWIGAANAAFGRLLAERRVLVLNDPLGNLAAATKIYHQHLPEASRPDMLVSRDPHQIKSFADAHDGRAVIKPMHGSSGRSVFLLRSEDDQNANQMIETVARDGQVIAQEYVPAAAAGDVRLLLLNGRPLQRNGRYAALRRVAAAGDFRNNGNVGAQRLRTDVTDAMIAAAELLAPRLIRDGLFLVGVDVAGDKILELNVLSPGGLGWATRFEGIDFYTPVIEAIECKVAGLREFGGDYDNAYWATLDASAADLKVAHGASGLKEDSWRR